MHKLEDFIIKNDISINFDKNRIFFLNTNGEFYAINFQRNQVEWVLNFKNLENKFEIFSAYSPSIFNDEIFLAKFIHFE